NRSNISISCRPASLPAGRLLIQDVLLGAPETPSLTTIPEPCSPHWIVGGGDGRSRRTVQRGPLVRRFVEARYPNHFDGTFLGRLDDLGLPLIEVSICRWADRACIRLHVEDFRTGVFAQAADDTAVGDPDAGYTDCFARTGHRLCGQCTFCRS